MKNPLFKRLTLSVCFPFLGLYTYWRDLNGDHSGTQLLWGIVVAIIAGLAIFLYVPVAKKVERGSIVWTLGLLFAILVPAVLILGSMGETIVWARAVSLFAIMTPAIHLSAQRCDRRYTWSLLKRPTPTD